MTHINESEKILEARLVREAKDRGGIAIKLTSQFHRGLPDRLVLLPYHTSAFVELKTTGKTASALQNAAITKLRSMGYFCFLIDSSESLDSFLAKMDRRLRRCEESAKANLEQI